VSSAQVGQGQADKGGAARELVLAIDQGTTGTTALLLDREVNVVAAVNVEFPNHYPKPGWVEHEAAEIWHSVEQAVVGALTAAGGLGAIRVVAVGITNQRETSLFWDRETGEPLHRALVWQDRRTADACARLRAAGEEERVRAKTGLVLDPYFSATKAQWVLDHVPGARAQAASGRLCFGTVDSYLAWRLCGAHVTDASNASRTLLMNLDTGDWDPELLELFDVPRAVLPRICDNAEVVGHTRGLSFLPDGVPVAGMAGDQQSALFGQACFAAGEAKCTYGTGAFVLLNTGAARVPSKNGLLTTVAWRLGGQTTFALEGSAFIAGAAVQWLRDGLGIIQSASEVEALAASVPDSGGVVFVPALAGLGAPHWRPEARGLLCGITGGTTKAHIARAVLEGVALQIGDILQAMAADAGAPLQSLRVDGGAAKNDLLMQAQADILGVEIRRPTVLETTALGAAFLAGLGAGFWESTEAIAAAWRMDRAFAPRAPDAALAALREGWARALPRA
jgi:glycerol kinase